MDRRQILQNLFGYQSEEEDANSNYELDHQANDVSAYQIWFFSNIMSVHKHETRDGSCHVLKHTRKSDGGLERENEGKAENKREPEVNTRVADLLGSSRSPDSEKGKDAAALSAAIFHEVFGDSDDEEPGEYAVLNQTNENTVSPKSIGNYAEESQVENAGPDEGAIYECEEESTETKVKGKEAASSDVFEIPLHPPPVDPDQMATIKFSNIIAIDPNPFDPATYVEDDFYVTDESGTKKCIPHTNIIRWREVTNPDGTTSVSYYMEQLQSVLATVHVHGVAHLLTVE
ncbi:hypothetical protein DH2020_043152 [Rehmannia glutinosa]|uniref:Uncharacterized protein n=1 Tax=Rehmannia glutinosa TaxID=99300 RepID=A0ABR0ULD4_REHGL